MTLEKVNVCSWWGSSALKWALKWLHVWEHLVWSLNREAKFKVQSRVGGDETTEREPEREEDYWKSMTGHSEVPVIGRVFQGGLDDLALTDRSLLTRRETKWARRVFEQVPQRLWHRSTAGTWGVAAISPQFLTIQPSKRREDERRGGQDKRDRGEKKIKLTVRG